MNKLFIKAGLNIVIALTAAQLICLPAVAEVSKEVLDSISKPNQVETSIGALEFLDRSWSFPVPQAVQ